MAWGLPPKYEVEYTTDLEPNIVLEHIKTSLEDFGYSIDGISSYTVEARKKMKHSFFSVLAFERAKLFLFIRATNDGVVNFSARYNFTSAHAMALSDLGRSKAHIDEVVNDLIIQGVLR